MLIDPNRYDIRFIAYQLRSERLQNMVALHKRGATIQGITRDNLKELEITLPPLLEQRKIAGVLGVVQRAMEQQERLLALTAELKKALLHQLFTAGLRGEPQKQTEIGPVPESWEISTVGDVAHVKGGKRLPKGDKFADKPTPFPYIQSNDQGSLAWTPPIFVSFDLIPRPRSSATRCSREDLYISISRTHRNYSHDPDWS